MEKNIDCKKFVEKNDSEKFSTRTRLKKDHTGKAKEFPENVQSPKISYKIEKF